MKLVFILLLTALITFQTHALPTPKSLPQRDANGTLLELITEYLEHKEEVEQANNIKTYAEAQASSKEAAIKSMIFFTNSTMTSQVAPTSTIAASTTIGALNTPTSTSPGSSAPEPTLMPSTTAYPSAAEPYTVIVPTGPAVVYAFRGTTSTVSLNPTTTTSAKNIPSATIVLLSGTAPLSTTSATPKSSALPTLMASSPTPLTDARPITVLNPTGPAIILASQGGIQTVTLSATTSTAPASATLA